MTMGGTASFCTGVRSISSLNKTQRLRGNSPEDIESFTNMHLHH